MPQPDESQEAPKREIVESQPENWAQTLKKWSKERQKDRDLKFYGGLLLTAAGTVAAGAALFGALPIAVLPFGAAAMGIGALSSGPQIPGRVVRGFAKGFGG